MKNRSENEVQIGKASQTPFCLDLGGFRKPSWSQVGRENRAKTGQDRPRQAKTKEDKGSEEKGRERKRKGRDCKEKVWKSVA